ncbi:IS4 family transposase [Ferrimicrobium acidiphilum]|uniref:IS4 family transposase n=1 Tax=Ferrimicrobium acidiphilum TaxID=121039 RepID=UPI0023F0F2EB|nr:IS4 family transposase [Ferrimicrobium acidiphilum]
MPRPGWRKQPVDSRLTDHISIGVLTRTLTKDLIDEILLGCNKVQQRIRLLPSRVVMYYVLAMSLYPQDAYEEVMRHLVEGLRWQDQFRSSWNVPSKAAIFKARMRLGAEPMKKLFSSVAKPLASPGTPGSFYRGLRLVAIDGTTLDVSDSPANLAHFTKPTTPIGSAANAKARVVGLVECGTHAIFRAEVGPYSVAEQVLAREVVPYLKKGMLCIADRGLFGYELWKQASEGGAELLWRAKSNYRIEMVGELEDGSYLGNVYHHKDRARKRPLLLRVIEYKITEGEDPDSFYRLFCTITDPTQAPAAELAALYGQRWEIESAFDELKAHQNESRRVLRSQSPELVYQEVWGILALHFAIRALMCDVADSAGRDPDRLSFVGSLRAARRSATTSPGFSPSALSGSIHQGL